MALDVTYGNISADEAGRLAFAASAPTTGHVAGCTEPWVTDLICSLLGAQGGYCVLETGAFMGFTTQALIDKLWGLDGGTLHCCEIDEARRDAIWRALHIHSNVIVRMHGDVFQFLAQCQPGSIDVAFVDDDHGQAHVERELALLYPCMRKGGLILCHDVTGACSYIGDTVVRYGGIVLDLPRLGPAGGLGIIQCR